MENLIIIPTYNERDNIGGIISAIFKMAPGIKILVVDDNSPDKTSEVVKSLQSEYPNLSLFERPRKEGLGLAYLDAFQLILKDNLVECVIMMDADFSHDPKYLPELLEVAKKFDVVVGSRYVKNGGTVGWEAWRRFLSKFGNLYSRLITKMPIFDCTGGFNLIKTDFLRKIDLSRMDMSGYAFQIELKYLLWKAGAQFKEIPIIFKNRLNGESKISNHIIKEGILAPWKIKKKIDTIWEK
ncbi:MAG: polyprenol monophosphomannose synthase [Patescibacteria group bacterium]